MTVLCTHDNPHDITTIDAAYVHPGVACMHMLIAGGQAAFFDTGTTHSLPHVLEVLRSKGLTPTDVGYVIPTHVHLDHAGGAGAMMRAFTNATMIVHPRGARHMIDPARLIEGVIAVYGAETTQRLYGEIVPVPEERVVVAQDGHELDFNGRLLRFFDTPGHARHHFCIVDVAHRGIFTGDTLGISYRAFDTDDGPFLFPTTPPTQVEPEALHASIDRLMATEPQTLYLTHFGPITPTTSLIEGLHEQLDRYVELTLALEGDDDLEQKLERQIADFFVAELGRHGSQLSEARVRRLLQQDIKLNAQGMAMWLRRRATVNEVKEPVERDDRG